VHRHAPAGATRRRLAFALALVLCFVAIEIVVGLLASSLALLSDAGHMVTDAIAISLALVASRLAERPPGGRLTFGLRRVEILSAQANGLLLGVMGGVIVFEAARRLSDPPDVDALPTLLTAIAGGAVNLGVIAMLAGARRGNLNVEGSFQHALTDLYASLAAAVAAAVILATGADRADAVASLVVAALMGRSASILLRASGRVLLEAAPAGLDPDEVGNALARSPGVVEVHDLHIWEITSGFPALSAHVLVGAEVDCHAARREMERLLGERFNVRHTTLQVDHAPGATRLRIAD
jgi:cobalt-zinc-cadmium efflux system protein